MFSDRGSNNLPTGLGAGDWGSCPWSWWGLSSLILCAFWKLLRGLKTSAVCAGKRLRQEGNAGNAGLRLWYSLFICSVYKISRANFSPPTVESSMVVIVMCWRWCQTEAGTRFYEPNAGDLSVRRFFFGQQVLPARKWWAKASSWKGKQRAWCVSETANHWPRELLGAIVVLYPYFLFILGSQGATLIEFPNQI